MMILVWPASRSGDGEVGLMFSPGGGQLSEHVLPGIHAWGAAVTSTGDPRAGDQGDLGDLGVTRGSRERQG